MMVSKRILVVDDEEGILEVVSDTLVSLPNVQVVTQQSSADAARMLAEESFDLLITDIRMPGLSGVELLRLARENDSEMPVLMITAYPSVSTAVESMKLGATDYITKPFLPDDLLARARRILEECAVRRENRIIRRHVERAYAFGDIVGRSAEMAKMFDTVRTIASKDIDILLTGETGTGKELVAQSIHRHSRRSGGRFMPVDCGAIPESLMESEFFGHERGSFTGAHARQHGVLELASGGTFFLDEIGELPMLLQVKLLRVLQERRFRRIGGKEEVRVDVRIVAATNRDLEKEIRDGRFRQDLFYRINVVQIELPPLRKRVHDIPLLTEHFVSKYAADMQEHAIEVSPDVHEVLMRYLWPGNVRELQNVLKRAIALCKGDKIVVDDLPDQIVMRAGVESSGPLSGFFELRSARIAEFETQFFTDLLERFEGDVVKASHNAGLPRGTLYRLLKKHGLQADDFRP